MLHFYTPYTPCKNKNTFEFLMPWTFWGSGWKAGKWRAIALSYPPPPPPIVFDNSSWKNAAESFTVALTLTLGGYESAIAPEMKHWLEMG